MEDPTKKLTRLLDAVELTEEEKQWLLTYLEKTDTSELNNIMLRKFHGMLAEQPEDKERTERMLQHIHERIGVQPSTRAGINSWFYRLAAACAACLLLTGALYWIRNDTGNKQALAKNIPLENSSGHDAGAESNKAFLTLADGSKIVLDNVRNRSIAQQGNAKVFKFNGKLAYRPASSGKDSVVFNSISTPRGGQYAVTLPDGTEVWLNAASSIRFPTAFAGSERRVVITGEAYFEVAPDAAMPFIVQVNTAEVQVLGTHFNIMAYQEEGALKTTLLEGTIRFTSGGSATMLKPGQQAGLGKDGRLNVKSNINTDDVVAWKNGMFHFEGTDIRAVMRQFSRWYDVEVTYSDTPLNELFHADIPRSATLQEALKALELTGKVRFGINGKNIVVQSW